jgi:hypothetical protein
MTDRMVAVELLGNEFEAQIVSEVLTDRSIPHAVRSFADTAYGGLFQFEGAWGSVLAPEEWAGEVRAVIAEVRESPGPLPGFE